MNRTRNSDIFCKHFIYLKLQNIWVTITRLKGRFVYKRRIRGTNNSMTWFRTSSLITIWKYNIGYGIAVLLQRPLEKKSINQLINEYEFYIIALECSQCDYKSCILEPVGHHCHHTYGTTVRKPSYSLGNVNFSRLTLKNNRCNSITFLSWLFNSLSDRFQNH